MATFHVAEAAALRQTVTQAARALSFARRPDASRLQRGLSVMELAGRVRVQRSLVYRWRRGSDAPPPPTTAERLALALVVRSEELRGRSIRQAAWLDEPAKELLACLVAQTAALRTG